MDREITKMTRNDLETETASQEEDKKTLIPKFERYSSGDFHIWTAKDEDGRNLTVKLISDKDFELEKKAIVSGRMVTDPRYGPQYEAYFFRPALMKTRDGIVEYLIAIDEKQCNIGTVRANAIYDKFGDKTLDILENDWEKIADVKGVSKEMAESLHVKHMEATVEEKAIKDFSPYGLDNAIIKKICKTYGENYEKIIKENPYRLYFEIKGIGFKTADKIARAVGLKQDCEKRVMAGLVYALEMSEVSGHCYLDKNSMEKAASYALAVSIPAKTYEAAEQILTDQKVLVCNDGKFYKRRTYDYERTLAEALVSLEKSANAAGLIYKDIEDEVIAQIEEESVYKFNKDQLQAVRNSLEKSISVLTGGPGTGKTTAINGIINAYKKLTHGRVSVTLAAPTGKAAKRMTAQTGLPARTIHRLLGVDRGNLSRFVHNAENKLDAGLYIIDECSMVGVALMSCLICAIPTRSTVVLVGDIDQLPSISCGLVLRDIIRAYPESTVRLVRNYRQENGSNIIDAAADVNAGKMPCLTPNKDSDFLYLEPGKDPATGKDPSEVSFASLVDACVKAQKQGIEYQVLIPMKRKTYGTWHVNRVIQKAVNPNGEVLVTRGKPGYDGYTEYRAGDKVIQTRNNYDLNVFNGDQGTVVEKTQSGELEVDFGDMKRVAYDKKNLSDLDLSYAITIHKSQGSEFNHVFIFFTHSQIYMMQRNLIYTAITRAAKRCVVFGPADDFMYGIQNNPAIKRNTALYERILAARSTGSAEHLLHHAENAGCSGKDVA